MTGLEKILGGIREEAAAEAKDLLEKAAAEEQELLAAAKAEGDAEAVKIEAAAAARVKDIEAARQSSIALQRRQEALRVKQEILAETLEEAKASLYALPEKDYFDLLVKLAAASAQPGEGELLLSEKDHARVPAGFEAAVQGALPGGAKLTLSENTRPIDGGFVLSYGGIEENCSFAALFDARTDEFSDLVRGILFG